MVSTGVIAGDVDVRVGAVFEMSAPASSPSSSKSKIVVGAANAKTDLDLPLLTGCHFGEISLV